MSKVKEPLYESKDIKKEKLEIEIPEDVICILQQNRITIQEEIKIALAIELFTKRSVTFARAAEIAGLSRYKFEHILKDRGIPSYEYTDQEYKQDKEALAL